MELRGVAISFACVITCAGLVSPSLHAQTAQPLANTTVGNARLVVPDGSSLRQSIAPGETRWFVFGAEPGKTYVVEAIDPDSDLTANTIGAMNVYASDGATTPPAETNVDCTTAGRAPALQLPASPDGMRCVVRSSPPLPGNTQNKRGLYVAVGSVAGSSFEIRVRESTIYGRWTTNGYDFHVELENTTGDTMCAEIVFLPNAGDSYAGTWSGAVTPLQLTIPPFGANKTVFPNGTLVGADNKGTLRIGACPSPVNFVPTSVHVSTYAYNPLTDKYLYYFTNAANNGTTANSWSSPAGVGSGTVTSVATGPGLTGGPITTAGTIGLAATNLLPTTACAAGQVVKWSGSAWACQNETASSGTVTNVASGTGIVGGPITTTGTLSLDPKYQLPQPALNNATLRYDAVGSTSWLANPLLLARQDGGVVMTGTLGSGSVPASGAGGRTMWYPGKAAFRAGYATSTQWDDASIGLESIGLGYNTVASGGNSTSIGGTSTASGNAATTIGWNNVASGAFSTAIGNGNTAAAANSIAMGQQARTTSGQSGSFVFADSQNFPFSSPISNEFAVRSTGGARFVTDIDVAGNPQRTVSITPGGIVDFGANTRQMLNLWNNNYGIGVQSFTTYFRSDSAFCWFAGGVHSDAFCDEGGGNFLMEATVGSLRPDGAASYLLVNGSIEANANVYAHTFNTVSDRAQKTGFATVHPEDILHAVVGLPMTTWTFKTEPGVQHIGPMAQDFHAAFELGADDRHIATVDAEGVALVAIQGLYAELKERDAAIAEQQHQVADEKREIAELRERLKATESVRDELAELRAEVAQLRQRRTAESTHASGQSERTAAAR